MQDKKIMACSEYFMVTFNAMRQQWDCYRFRWRKKWDPRIIHRAKQLLKQKSIAATPRLKRTPVSLKTQNRNSQQ